MIFGIFQNFNECDNFGNFDWMQKLVYFSINIFKNIFWQFRIFISLMVFLLQIFYCKLCIEIILFGFIKKKIFILNKNKYDIFFIGVIMYFGKKVDFG